MIIGFCITSDNADSPLDDRFGRAAYFAFIDSDSSQAVAIVENPGKNAGGSAGTAAVQIFANHHADAIIAPPLGPKAADGVKAIGLPVYRQGNAATIAEALERFNNGELEPGV